MDDAGGMDRSKALEEAAGHPEHLMRKERTPERRDVERRAIDELGDEPRAALVIAGVMDASDVP